MALAYRSIHPFVVAGLDPAIHVFLAATEQSKSCMPGTRPGMMEWNTPAPLALTGMVSAKALTAAIAACLICSSAHADWATFGDSRGTSVQYPRERFPVAAGSGMPPGPVLRSPDARARLHVFTLPNEQRESPTEFIARTVTDRHERLSYKRVTNRFFVFSAAEGGLILYRRCNFGGAAIHCFDVRYPRGEKRAWDGPVTRMSFTLTSR